MEDDIEQVAVDVLGNPYRRFVLSHLNGQEKPLTAASLARAVVEWETEGTESDDGIDEDAVREVTLRLHHEHLPLLEAAGVLSYDWRERRITEWRQPNRGDEWLAPFPAERLYETTE
jgi:hypothetical protein